MEFLKVFLSAFVLLVITTLVFFAIYFLFPDFSENAFGISAYSEGFVLGSNGVSENGDSSGDFDSFLNGERGKAVMSALESEGVDTSGIDINELEAKASEYLGKTGESLDEIFSNANIARMITGKIPDEVSSFLSELGLAL